MMQFVIGAFFQRIAGLLLLGMLAACSQTPLAVPASGFAVNGKVNILQGNRSDTAQFAWLATPEHDQLTLSTPFGSTLAELTLHYQGSVVSSAVLNRGDLLEQASNPEELLMRLTGVALPVSGLRWWLRGLPRPDEPFSRDGEALLQNDWRIIASDYRNGTQPYRIELMRDKLKVRILINQWNTAVP
ncbi:lipoprotein insertase outer membrane protein LolB [Chitinibacter sp. S2-10]|uniref:lipoprotein insertase outer membrane protein LolB n=1 Tax=Chitinibacter sp. S2-10 TaxID=3373597 RepID=UPI0039779AE7